MLLFHNSIALPVNEVQFSNILVTPLRFEILLKKSAGICFKDVQFRKTIPGSLLKIVDWGECELSSVNFANSTNLTDIASPKEKSFSKDYVYILGGFQNCTSLKQIPLKFFTNISNIRNVSRMFENCTSLTGNAIELWNNSNIEYHENCYKGCTNLSNYDQIPEGWK